MEGLGPSQAVLQVGVSGFGDEFLYCAMSHLQTALFCEFLAEA